MPGSLGVFVGRSRFLPPRIKPFGAPLATIGPTLAICAANPTNPTNLCSFSGVPKLSGLEFPRLFTNAESIRAPEIIEKPKENHGFLIIAEQFWKIANLEKHWKNLGFHSFFIVFLRIYLQNNVIRLKFLQKLVTLLGVLEGTDTENKCFTAEMWAPSAAG